MGLLSGLATALGGLAVGGPIGAVAGGIAGLLGDGDSRPTQRTESTVNLAALTPEQRRLLQNAYNQIVANTQTMSPQQRERYISQLEGQYYAPMAREIQDSYAQSLGQQNAFHARGGMRGSSMAQALDEKLALRTAGLLGQARAQARSMGEDAFFRRDENRRANISSALGVRGMVGQERMSASGQTQSVFNPMAPYTAGMGMLGYGLMDQDSWFNRGGKQKIGSWWSNLTGGI